MSAYRYLGTPSLKRNPANNNDNSPSPTIRNAEALLELFGFVAKIAKQIPKNSIPPANKQSQLKMIDEIRYQSPNR
jgi:hypothetical protein